MVVIAEANEAISLDAIIESVGIKPQNRELVKRKLKGILDDVPDIPEGELSMIAGIYEDGLNDAQKLNLITAK